MSNALLAVSGFTIGYAVEAVLAVVLIIVIISAARKKKVKQDAGETSEAATPPTQAEIEPEEPVTAEQPASEPMQETSEEVAAAADLEGKTVFEAKSISFDEAYEALNREQKGFFNHIKNYALEKANAEEKRQANCICVKASGKQLLKLTIKRGITVAQFMLENDLLKNYKRSGESAVAIKTKATEIPVYDVEAMNTACRMVDLMEEQNEKERQAAKERRKDAQRKQEN